MTSKLYALVDSDRYKKSTTIDAYQHIEAILFLGGQELTVSLHDNGKWHFTVKQHFTDREPSVNIQGDFTQGITTQAERDR